MVAFEDELEQATVAARSLYEDVASDLDEEQGGIGWWHGHLDAKRSALIGEYLLASCAGIEHSLLQGSLAVETYKEKEFAQNYARRSAWQAISRSGGDQSAYIEATKGGAAGNRRKMEMSAASDQSLFYLAQALDRLAAVVVMVASIKERVLKTDWGILSALSEKAIRNTIPQGPKQKLESKFETPGTLGRDEQNALLRVVVDWRRHGPVDWLPWLLRSRNTATHRAPRLNVEVMYASDAGRTEGMFQPFWTQPDWADTEVMLQHSRNGLQDLFLMRMRYDVLSGLRSSVSALVAETLGAAKHLWILRRETPTLIVQRGGMWPEIRSSTPLAFPGYGKPAKATVEQVGINPEMARRWRAAKVLDTDKDFWIDS